MDKVPMSPKTVNKNIQFISALFRWAVNEELIENNPARNLYNHYLVFQKIFLLRLA
jgi:site-specific recombinase XerD